MKQLSLTAVTVLLLSVSVVWGGPYEDGEAALKRADYAEAIKQWQVAADEGNAKAEFAIGFYLHHLGKGAPRDDAKAVTWYQRAAEHSNAQAQHFLGIAYRNGEGVRQDYAEAVRWFRAAAAQGYGNAMFMLGNAYQFGRGVPQDRVRALMWFTLASSQNATTAAEARNDIVPSMTRPDVAEAQKLANECQQRKFKDCE
jgi:uncharacterized protein